MNEKKRSKIWIFILAFIIVVGTLWGAYNITEYKKNKENNKIRYLDSMINGIYNNVYTDSNNEQEIEDVIKTMTAVGINVYNGSLFLHQEAKRIDESKYKIEIAYYEDIMNNYFTKEAKKNFETERSYETKGNKSYYYTSVDLYRYMESPMEIVSIKNSSNKIEAIICCEVWDLTLDKYYKANQQIEIIRENDRWKLNKFISPEKLLRIGNPAETEDFEETEFSINQVELKKNNTNNLKECTYYYEYTYEGDNEIAYEYVYNIEELDNTNFPSIEEQLEEQNEKAGFQLKYENGKYQIRHMTGIKRTYDGTKLAMEPQKYYDIDLPSDIVKILINPDIGNGIPQDKILILDKSGQIYYVNLEMADVSIEFRIYKIANLENVKNIISTGISEYYQGEPQGGASQLFVKTNDGNVYKLEME